jgi:hypothetical protein
MTAHKDVPINDDPDGHMSASMIEWLSSLAAIRWRKVDSRCGVSGVYNV